MACQIIYGKSHRNTSKKKEVCYLKKSVCKNSRLPQFGHSFILVLCMVQVSGNPEVENSLLVFHLMHISVQIVIGHILPVFSLSPSPPFACL